MTTFNVDLTYIQQIIADDLTILTNMPDRNKVCSKHSALHRKPKSGLSDTKLPNLSHSNEVVTIT
jgi:hypothetical protein